MKSRARHRRFSGIGRGDGAPAREARLAASRSTIRKNTAQADHVANECGEAIAVQGDVAEDADCRRVAKAVLDKWGRIDALVNNAGTTKFVAHADLEGLAAEDFERIFRVNVIGPFQMIRACAPALKESRGCVVNVSSVAALLGTGSSIAYAASKAALDTMTLLARARARSRDAGEHRRARLREHAVADRRRTATRAPQELERALRASARRSRPRPQAEDVADAIAWLIEGARRVTGEIIYVDGGMHIASPR